MKRGKALALAGASTLVLGSGLVASAAVGGGVLGFGSGARDGVGSFTAPPVASASKPRVSIRSRDVYDRYVVDVGGRSSRTSTHASMPSAPPAVIAASVGPAPAMADSDGGGGPARPTPTTIDDASSHPTPTTTKVTPTTRPDGVPDDWPAGKPVPPMPPNCREPQLEDNGVWNCQQAGDD